jgi:hypothetical protein
VAPSSPDYNKRIRFGSRCFVGKRLLLFKTPTIYGGLYATECDCGKVRRGLQFAG